MKFKHSRYTTAIIGFTLFSCDDYIEEENLSNVNGEAFYTTEEGFETLVNANYAQLKEIYGNEPWLFSAGTDLYAEGRDQEPPGLSQYIQLTPSADGVNQLYSSGYQAIQSANMAIHYGELNAQNATINQRIGEVRYLRASAYFLMAQTDGGAGLVAEYIERPALTFDRNSAEETYSCISSEPEDGVSVVGRGADSARVNTRAVQHWRAKVHLTTAYESFGASDDFAKGAGYPDAAIAGQSLSIRFEDLWTPGNEL